MDFLKKIFFSYQKVCWYVNLAKGEYAKVGSFIPETLMVMTYLTVQGVKIESWYIPIFYLLIMGVAAIIGVFLAKIGVAKYNTTLGNAHNEELTRILSLTEKIAKHLNIKDK
jgi:hypothetical protein